MKNSFFGVLAYIVSCMGATVAGSYSYSVVAPSFVGDTMNVSCPTGYAWNSLPSVSSFRTATCTNISGSGIWVIGGAPDQCLRMSIFWLVCLHLCVHISIINHHHLLNNNSNYIINYIFSYVLYLVSLVDCSTASIAGPVSYTVPSPATLGTSMNVSCNFGYQWTVTPYNGPQTTTCSNVSGSGQWVIPGGATCVCMIL